MRKVLLALVLFLCGCGGENVREVPVTVAVDCTAAVAVYDGFPPGKLSVLPADGIVLPETEVMVAEGDSAFAALRYVAEEYGLQLEYNGLMPGAEYVESIGHLAEFDGGASSGWHYSVNGVTPGVGAGGYVLAAGDVVVWYYTLEI